jgi:hypothetical protein
VIGMSYTWRSILKGLEIVKEGYIWRVGSEKNIHIWTDPWLPREVSRMVLSHQGANIITKVSDLIDPSMFPWDEALVR